MIKGEGTTVAKGVTPDEAFDFVLDPAQYTKADTKMVWVTKLADTADGMLAREDGKFLGRFRGSVITRYRWERPRSIDVTLEHGVPRRLHAWFEIDAVEGGTRIHHVEELDLGHGPLGWLHDLLARTWFARSVDAEVTEIGRLLEQGSAAALRRERIERGLRTVESTSGLDRARRSARAARSSTNPHRTLKVPTCPSVYISAMGAALRWICCCVALVLAGAVLASCGSASSPGAAARSTAVPTKAASPGTAPAPGHSPVSFGIDVNTADADIGRARVPKVLGLIKQAGASAVRFGGNWNSAEPSPGVYDFGTIDALLSTTRSHDLTLLLGLGNEPAWDATNGNPNAPPKDCNSPTATCASVSDYVTALVRNAAPEGLHYLIARNEPQDFDKNWVGSDPMTYAHFQQVVYRAAHDADPSIAVLSGGTDALSPSLVALGLSLSPEVPYPKGAVAFASSLYGNPAWCDSLDVLDLHVGDHGPVYSPQIVDASEKALQACNGGRHVPVWVTEVGYTSVASVQSSPVYKKELQGKYQGGEPGQARFLTDTFSALERDPNVVGINWTFIIDPNATSTPPPDSSFYKLAGFGNGLATSSYTPKTAYTAFKDIAEGRERS